MLRKWEALPDFMQCGEIRAYYDVLSKKPAALLCKRVFDVLAAAVLLPALLIVILFLPKIVTALLFGAMAAIAAGADGIMCEVHNDPEHAWCDGAESITPETFDDLMGRLKQLAPIVGREL